MRVVIQRVSEASVEVKDVLISEISRGLLILLGIEHEDEDSDAEWLCQKIANLRIFNDEQGKMNKSIQEVKGEMIVVSQFTLHASTKKGNRPSYIRAARPERAEPMYEAFADRLHELTGLPVKKGVFGAMMKVGLLNDGPVTIVIDSKSRE